MLSGDFLGASGPLWFAVALLAFSLVYAVVRLVGAVVRDGAARRPTAGPSTITNRAVAIAVLALTALIALIAFLVRLVQPIGTDVMNMQLGCFASCIVLFVAGLWIGRRGLLEAIPAKAGRTWLWLSIGIGLPVWLALLGFGGALEGKGDLYMGDMHWQAVGYAVWESFFCVAFSLGLLSYTAFGAYTFHAPILVGVSVLMIPVTMHPLAKTLVAASAAWVLSVAFAWVVRKIPGVGRFFA